MLGELTAEQIERILHAEVIGRIGCHANGRTFVVPVTYAYDGIRLICHSAHGMKIDMMRANPEVCFEVDQVDNLANWRSVVAWGKYEELHGSEAAAAIGFLADRVMPMIASATSGTGRSVTPHGSKARGDSAIVYCIRLTRKTGRFEKS